MGKPSRSPAGRRGRLSNQPLPLLIEFVLGQGVGLQARRIRGRGLIIGWTRFGGGVGVIELGVGVVGLGRRVVGIDIGGAVVGIGLGVGQVGGNRIGFLVGLVELFDQKVIQRSSEVVEGVGEGVERIGCDVIERYHAAGVVRRRSLILVRAFFGSGRTLRIRHSCLTPVVLFRHLCPPAPWLVHRQPHSTSGTGFQRSSE